MRHAEKIFHKKQLYPCANRALITTGMVYVMIVCPAGWASPTLAVSEDSEVVPNSAFVEYNPVFIHGTVVDVSRFSAGNFIAPGNYRVTVLVNNESRGQHNLNFGLQAGQTSASPCFLLDDLQKLGVEISKEIKQNFAEKALQTNQCLPIGKIINGSSENYDSGNLRLSLVIPQIYLRNLPRGYIDPNSWDTGVPALFFDYNDNLYSFYSGSGKQKDIYSNNLNLTMAANIGQWRLRKRLNTGWSNREGMSTSSLYGYGQTDITALSSQLTIGDSSTRGEIFDSFTLRGIQLQSDERMLPEGLRNYVPVLRGTAETNARVKVTQRGQTIYETTVPPGPFELMDVGAMGYGGDLTMTITEASGSERSQTVPFSTPPMLLHQGTSRFGFSIGQVKDTALNKHPKIMQGIWQYGLANMYTLYGGAQIAEHYRALAAGNAFNTPAGGISVEATHATSDLANNKTTSGNSFRLAYSKYLEPTDTNVTLAAWRYSTQGFYSLREANIARYGSHYDRYESDYRTRQRLAITMGQRLWNGAYLNLSGSLYRYWDNRTSAKQYALGYSQSQRYFSWSLSATRSRRGNGENLNNVMFSVNVPLGAANVNEKPLFSSLYSSYSRDNAGNASLQASANGSQGERNELTYGMGTSVGRYRSASDRKRVTGNMRYRSSYGQFGLTGSATNNSAKQFSLLASGSAVIHQGGVTLGPQLGDSAFAIVNVPGGEGAKLLNGYGSVVDSHGYAIMPALTAYRKNTVSVDAKGLPDTLDILENEDIVVPRAGSALFITMKTLVGKPMILTVRDANHAYMPIGTELIDAQAISQTVVGQQGQAFIRGWTAASGALFVADDKSVKCQAVPESRVEMTPQNNIARLEVICVR